MLQSQQALPLRVFLTPVHGELHSAPESGGGIQGISPFRPASLMNLPLRDSNEVTGSELGAAGMDSRLVMERVKIFTDGSLGAETAAIRSLPSLSSNDAATFASTSEGAQSPTSAPKGVLVYERAALSKMLLDAYCAGYRVEVHAIGDAAAEQVLSALDDSEALIEQELQSGKVVVPVPGGSDAAQRRHWRPILTHCQVLGADLIDRMAEKGIVANVQPSFVPTGNYFVFFHLLQCLSMILFCFNLIPCVCTDMKWVQARIGPRQLEYSYVWKTLLLHSRADELAESLKDVAATSSRKSSGSAGNVSGVYVAGGSDAPIESPNPFTGMYDAMFRTNKNRLKSSEGDAEIVFKPEECLSFSQALWIYTIGETDGGRFNMLPPHSTH